MRNMKLWAAFVAVLPAMVFAAAEGGSNEAGKFRVISPAIDTWAAGTVSNVDSKTGDVTINGANLPYATAHAQMRQELGQKLVGIQDKAERKRIVAQVHKAWNDRLEAALKQKPGEAKDFTLNQPKEERDAVILNGSDIREMPFFQKLAERKEHMKTGAEAVAIEAALTREFEAAGEEAQPTTYTPREKAAEAREKLQSKVEEAKGKIKEKAAAATPEEKAAAKEKLAEKGAAMKEKAGEAREKMRERIMAGREKLANERLSLSELKKGDKVLVGFDKDSMDYYAIIRHDVEAKAQPVSSEKKEPATVK